MLASINVIGRLLTIRLMEKLEIASERADKFAKTNAALKVYRFSATALTLRPDFHVFISWLKAFEMEARHATVEFWQHSQTVGGAKIEAIGEHLEEFAIFS